tara:strand:- start:135348 stop:136616 length:1269 start_codon:yes stop_codon:yes gene_type:complete
MLRTSSSFISLLLLVASPGCAQLLGFDEVTAAGDAADAAPDAMVDPLACALEEIAPALGTSTGNTEAASNERDLSCGSANSNDLLLGWRAPVTDYFVFSTAGSNFDTVLALYDGCEGGELVCNNNTGKASESEIVVKLEQDRDVLIAIDGFAGDTGDVSLAVERVSCPDSDLEGQTFPLSLTTSGFGDDFENTCGGSLQQDRAYHYVAPADGHYAFTAIGDGYSAVVSLIDGARCEDRELGCNAAFKADYTAEVVRKLDAGQAVSVYVDGVDGAGNFELDIQPVAIACSETTLQHGSNVLGDYETRSMSSSCSSVDISNGVNIQQEMNDKTYQVEIEKAPLGCSGNCSLTITANGQFSAALLEGPNCSGAEEQCMLGGPGTVSLSVPVDDSEDKTKTLIVTDQDPTNPDGFTVEMFCAIACA